MRQTNWSAAQNEHMAAAGSVTVQDKHTIIEQERNRIARDLHDGVVQQIVIAAQRLELLQHFLEQGQQQEAQREIEHITAILNGSLDELRNSINALLPVSLDRHEFADALATLCYEFSRNNPQTSIKSEFPALHHVPLRLEGALYRVMQEALANIQKHAHASEVEIVLIHEAETLRLTIHDNGVGLPAAYQPQGTDTSAIAEGLAKQEDRQPPAVPAQRSRTHLGLQTMRSRVQEAGGAWQIQSPSGAGTTISATFPLLSYDKELTNREHEILQLISEGLTNQAIAQRLTISYGTVMSHIHHILQKMQVKDRNEAVAVANTQGWIK